MTLHHFRFQGHSPPRNRRYAFLVWDPNDPFPSLTQQIFKNATDPDPKVQKLAWAGILVLISLIFVLNVGIRYFARSFQTRNA